MNVNGTAIKDIDIFAQAKGQYAALVKTVPVQVTDGALTLAFTPTTNRTKISALEIIPEAGK